MKEHTIRLNITLPQSIAASLDAVAGHGKRSRFIAEAVAEKIERLKTAEMAALLTEGYQVQQEESQAITRDFDGLAEPEGSNDEHS